jgi:hypothetical protein
MRFAIFDPVGSFFSIPTLQSLLEELEQMGAFIDIFMRFGKENLHKTNLIRSNPFPIPFKIFSGNIESTLRNWKWYVKYQGRKGNQQFSKNRYDLVFAINPEGVIAAHRNWVKTKTPYVYLSFEMFFKDELIKKGQLLEKQEEIIASRYALFIIIQDEDRGRLLSKENNLSLDQMDFMPVAPKGAALPSRTNYLRQRFNIDKGKMIILHSGTFRDWTCADELITSLREWPDELVLIVHTHYKKFSHEEDPYLAALKKLPNKNLFISNTPLDQNEYGDMICSADAGLVFYKPNNKPPFGGKNIQHIGLSSGKLASYARHGVPIICGRQKEYREIIRTYKFGEYTDQFSEIPNLAKKIHSDWSFYSQEALRFFRDQLDFNIHWPRIWKRIEDHISLSKHVSK